MHAYEVQAKVIRALAHPVRLRILDILREEEQCVCHITAVLGLRQPYVSQQLAILRAAGLVSARKEGLNIYYRVEDERVLTLMDLVRILVRDRVEKAGGIFALPPPIGPPPSCSCPKCRARRGGKKGPKKGWRKSNA